MYSIKEEDIVKIESLNQDISKIYQGNIQKQEDITLINENIKMLSKILNRYSDLEYVPQKLNHNSIAIYDKVLLFYIDFQIKEIVLSESFIEKENLEAENIINHNRLMSVEYLIKTDNKIKELNEKILSLKSIGSESSLIQRIIHRIKYRFSKKYRDELEEPYLEEIKSIKKRQLNMNERINKIIAEQEENTLYFKDNYKSYVDELNLIKQILKF